MTFQKRLLKIMRQRNMKVADLARHLDIPYTTVREWVLHARLPVDQGEKYDRWIDRKLQVLERK